MAPHHALQGRPQWSFIQALRGPFEFFEGVFGKRPARRLERRGELQMRHHAHAQFPNLAGFRQGPHQLRRRLAQAGGLGAAAAGEHEHAVAPGGHDRRAAQFSRQRAFQRGLPGQQTARPSPLRLAHLV